MKIEKRGVGWPLLGPANMTEMWNLKKMLWPKKRMSFPAAKITHQGKLISKPQDIKNTLRKEYSERLRKRPKRS